MSVQYLDIRKHHEHCGTSSGVTWNASKLLNMSLARIVLMVSGRGGDVSSYQPERDATQWWNRRDALVRCVAASLYSVDVTNTAAAAAANVELVLVFDQDWSRFAMTVNTTSLLLPTERNILSLWKQAVQLPNSDIASEGLSVCFVPSSLSTSKEFQSKRELLQHLQSTCSIEFLRQHHLNKSPTLILRQVNQRKLQDIWNQWQQDQGISNDAHGFDSILPQLLPVSSHVVACQLHESSAHELPYWNASSNSNGNDKTLLLVLFLGAVRDMSRSQQQSLRTYCQGESIPLVQFRLGPVPEFTSKILAVVAHHHSRERLTPAIQQLAARAASNNKKRVREGNATESLPSTTFHTVCIVPLKCDQVTQDLDQRNDVLWNLVRCTVASLWRSKMVGQHAEGHVENRLTLGLKDAVITLDASHVTALAEQHQAAPSEYQILNWLKQNLLTAKDHGWDTFVDQLKPRRTAALYMDARSKADLFQTLSNTDPTRTYAAVARGSTSRSLLCLVSLGGNLDACPTMAKLIATLHRAKIPTLAIHPLATKARDRVAATISILQHFAYQQTLILVVDEAIARSEARLKG